MVCQLWLNNMGLILNDARLLNAWSHRSARFALGTQRKSNASCARSGGSARAPYLRDPQAWSWEFDLPPHEWRKLETCKANTLVQRAEQPRAKGIRRELERVVRELWAYLPSDAEETRAEL